MSAKAHGTCAQPVQSQLRFGCDRDTADRICKSLRHCATHFSTVLYHTVTAPLHHCIAMIHYCAYISTSLHHTEHHTTQY
jgi:hypothetical protein